MITLTTTKQINLAQLIGETGCIEMGARAQDGTTTITCANPAVTAEALQAAVDAHVAQPEPEPATLDPEVAARLKTDDRGNLVYVGPNGTETVIAQA